MTGGSEWNAEAEAIRAAVMELEPVGRRRRYSAALRERILRYVRDGEAAGGERRELSEAAGVPAKTVDRWYLKARRAARAGAGGELVAVRIAAAAKGVEKGLRLVVVTPAGFRLEGLDVAGAVAVLRALG